MADYNGLSGQRAHDIEPNRCIGRNFLHSHFIYTSFAAPVFTAVLGHRPNVIPLPRYSAQGAGTSLLGLLPKNILKYLMGVPR